MVLGLGQGRQEQGGENGDNGNNHKQLNECKSPSPNGTRRVGLSVDSALSFAYTMMYKDYSHGECKVLMGLTVTPSDFMSIPESGDSSISHIATVCTDAVGRSGHPARAQMLRLQSGAKEGTLR